MLHHPLIVALLILLLLCMVSETVGSKTILCFLTNEELKTAVKNYMAGGTKKKETLAKYGSPIGNWCVGKVKDFSNVFAGEEFNRNKFNEPLTNWDTSKATTMYAMFSYTSDFNQPLNSWNVSQVTIMSNMFHEASSFNQPLDSWNVGKVTDMSKMFHYAKSFNQALDGHWNVGKVTDMSWMFAGAIKFNQPLDHWNVAKVLDMSYMFYGASSFNQNLCFWGPQVSLDCNIENIFVYTNCPYSWDTKLSGPFCRDCHDAMMILKNGLEKTGLIAQRDITLNFKLKETVAAGQHVTCALQVPNGDADLYIKFGKTPNVPNKDCDCGSTIQGPFDEDCTTEQPAKTKTTAYVAVVAEKDSSDMTILCFINDVKCLHADQPCNQTNDCCGTMVCDGNKTAANRCVPCKKPEPCGGNAKCASLNKKCARTTQCCRWNKCSGVCQRNR